MRKTSRRRRSGGGGRGGKGEKEGGEGGGGGEEEEKEECYNMQPAAIQRIGSNSQVKTNLTQFCRTQDSIRRHVKNKSAVHGINCLQKYLAYFSQKKHKLQSEF